MSTIEIPRTQWVRFFDSFSHRHDGWLIRVEVRSPTLGAAVVVADQALAGLSLSSTDPLALALTVSDTRGMRLTHEIALPMRIWLKQGEGDADEALAIEAEGASLVITFRSSLPVECVDGI